MPWFLILMPRIDSSKFCQIRWSYLFALQTFGEYLHQVLSIVWILKRKECNYLLIARNIHKLLYFRRFLKRWWRRKCRRYCFTNCWRHNCNNWNLLSRNLCLAPLEKIEKVCFPKPARNWTDCFVYWTQLLFEFDWVMVSPGIPFSMYNHSQWQTFPKITRCK